ncbi:uncharacterized protein LOC136062831 [Quercus suber]|uniref:uncharacterized protein LOC136062831 n=1 Tax=Quercus suber TaxID=58331 RepID=UPI0032DF61FB
MKEASSMACSQCSDLAPVVLGRGSQLPMVAGDPYFAGSSSDEPPLSPDNMGDSQCSFSLTTFSPSWKLAQIEHALTTVGSGQISLGIIGSKDSLSHQILELFTVV